jgi:pyruvate/2-oxoglutarate/acetoin dehydrogenase E1 component
MMNSPGLKVVAPATPADAKGLLLASIRDANPVVFLEHSALYFTDGPVPEGETIVPLGVADVKRPGRNVTVVTYGALVREALAAAEALAGEGIDVEVLDLRTLKPLDEAAILASARKTGKVVVAYEGAKTAGVGAEVAALIAEQAIEYLEAPVVRVAAPDVPYPHNAVLMQAVMVDKDDIIAGIRKTWED